MNTLSHRQSKIQEKRKQTPFREFVMEIASWYPLNFYKNQGYTSKYHEKNGRIHKILNSLEYEEKRNNGYNNCERIDMYEKEGFGKAFSSLLFYEPHEALKIFQNCENCGYTDIAFASKNSYLSSCVLESENVLYSVQVKGYSTNVINALLVYDNCENIFSSKSVVKSFNIFYSAYIQNSNNIRLSSNLVGCYECMLCDGLMNQSYCIENKIYEKEIYFRKKEELLRKKELLETHYKQIGGRKGMNTGENIIGSSNLMSENVENGYLNYAIKNGRNVVFSGDGTVMENVYDGFSTGCLKCHDYYGVMGVGYNAIHIYCSVETAVNSHNCYYSYYLESCSFCLGCIGLKNKSYCILNKQYTKDERYEKAHEIFAQMEKDGTLGQFFPANMNPFYFNDTAAYLIDPSFTKEEVTAKGYLRRDEAIKVDIPEGMEIVKTNDLENYEGFDAEENWSINAEILKKVIQDEQGNYYRIIPMEYKFLVKHGLPLPRKHWLERMKENFKIN